MITPSSKSAQPSNGYQGSIPDSINNKLMVHMCIVKSTTIFLIVRLLLIRYNYMFRPSMLAIFRLYMKHLTISYIYTWMGLQFVGWGGCEISFSVCRRGVDRVCL